jgi:threonine aldolase
MRGFASDNACGIHPEILRAIERANDGHAFAYGADPWTARLEPLFRAHFGEHARAHLVFNGTAANALALTSCLKPFQTIYCAETAHTVTSECGAVEKSTGGKLTPVPAREGKITPDAVLGAISGKGDQHHVQPGAISIAQATEYGTIYTPAEIGSLAELAHSWGGILHVDGARLSNAAAALGLPLRAITTDAGVDVVSFGGTKNGLMFGEAVVFLNPSLGRDFRFTRKQGMQLASKMRFLSAQFEALLEGDLWLRAAGHANAMARRLAQIVSEVPGVTITQPVQTNAVFARLSKASCARMLETVPFHVWDESTGEVRWMCSFDTQEEDLHWLVSEARKACENS